MSGNANGYVFPPPLLAHPPFEARNLFRNSMVRGGREVENFGNYRGSYHDPNFNVENQSWSPYPESSFPKPRYHPQCNQRMQGMLPPSRKHAFPIGTSHCKRFRRPPIRVGSRPTDQSPQNGWNTSDVAVKYALGMLLIGQAINAYTCTRLLGVTLKCLQAKYSRAICFGCSKGELGRMEGPVHFGLWSQIGQ